MYVLCLNLFIIIAQLKPDKNSFFPIPTMNIINFAPIWMCGRNGPKTAPPNPKMSVTQLLFLI